MGEIARILQRTTMIIETRSKSRWVDRSMLATPKAPPDEHIQTYFDPEFADNPEIPSSRDCNERTDASRLDGQGEPGEMRELGWPS